MVSKGTVSQGRVEAGSCEGSKDHLQPVDARRLFRLGILAKSQCGIEHVFERAKATEKVVNRDFGEILAHTSDFWGISGQNWQIVTFARV